MEREWEVVVQRVYREGNRSANRLANGAASLSVGFHLFEDPTNELLEIIL